MALAFDEQHVRDPQAYATEIRVDGGTAVLSGEKWYVADGAHADWHVVAAREGGGVSLVLVPADAARISALRTFDGERQAVARYERVPVTQRLCAAAGVAAQRSSASDVSKPPLRWQRWSVGWTRCCR